MRRRQRREDRYERSGSDGQAEERSSSTRMGMLSGQQELDDTRDVPRLPEGESGERHSDRRCHHHFPSAAGELKKKTPVQAAEGACKAGCEAGLPQSLLDEHAQ